MWTGSKEPVLYRPPSPQMSAKPEHKTSPPFQHFPYVHSYVILRTAPFPSEKTKALNNSSSSLFFLPQDLIRFCVCFDISTSAPSTSQWPQMITCWQVLLADGIRGGVLKSSYLQWRGPQAAVGQDLQPHRSQMPETRVRHILDCGHEKESGEASECLRGS